MLFFVSQSTYAKQYTHSLCDSGLSSMLLCRNTAEDLRAGRDQVPYQTSVLLSLDQCLMLNPLVHTNVTCFANEL